MPNSRLLSSFYGQFSSNAPPVQWGRTINMLSYPLIDALYWVDDCKDIYTDTQIFAGLLA